MAETSNFALSMKNQMLNDYADKTFGLDVFHEPIGGGESVRIQRNLTTPFSAASQATISLSNNESYTIPEGRKITSIQLLVGLAPHLNFSGFNIEFPNGGDLIVTQLDISLSDPV